MRRAWASPFGGSAGLTMFTNAWLGFAKTARNFADLPTTQAKKANAVRTRRFPFRPRSCESRRSRADASAACRFPVKPRFIFFFGDRVALLVFLLRGEPCPAQKRQRDHGAILPHVAYLISALEGRGKMMSAKTPVSTTELQAHLDEQLRFLERSADAFDRGFEDEGKRLAVAIRILVHDTNLSHSLLGQVGMKTQPFIDTSLPFDPKNVASHHGLISFWLGGGGAKYVPHLDSGFPARRIPFDQWWNEPVIVDGKRRQSLGRTSFSPLLIRMAARMLTRL